jgi:chaperonin GroES
MKVRPLGNRILVKPSTTEETTKSGIILAATSEKEKKAQGTIVEVGSGPAIAQLGLKVGDTVVFGKYSGDEVEIEDNGEKVEHKILNVGSEKDESEVLAIVE